MFLDRRGFAGQRRLDGLQVNDLDQPRVGGNLVAGCEENDVTRNQIARRNPVLAPVADHSCRGCSHFAKSLNRALGSVFLYEPEHYCEQHDHSNRNRLDSMTEKS